MIKRITSIFALSLSLLLFGTMTYATSPTDKTLIQRADAAYNPDKTYTFLYIKQEENVKEYKYKAKYIPIRDLFVSHVESVKWDNKSKVAEIKNDGSTLIFNLSNKKMVSSDSKIVLPKEWIRISQGRVEINSSIVAYLFDKYSESYKDVERDAWEKKLSFLGIKETEAIPGAQDKYLYVYVTYGKKTP
jgi:hypothetical protein